MGGFRRIFLNPFYPRNLREIFYVGDISLFRHFEAEAYAVVVLAEVADGLRHAVAGERRGSLEHLEEVFALEGEGESVGGAGDVGFGAQQEGLEVEGAFTIVGVGAGEGDVVDIPGELMVLREDELGVVGGDADAVVNINEFRLAVFGSD